MPNQPSVLVGISTYNRADILAKAIDSALAQKYPSVRVGVLDDGSTDDTPAIKERYPAVEWTRWANRGYIPARNHLMLTAGTDYYVSLDDDAWFVEGDEIGLAVTLLESDPSLGAVAFDILSPDQPHKRPRQPPALTGMFIGCGHVLRLSIVRALAGYAEFPGSYGGEEKDLCLRLLDAGYSVVTLSGVHVWHDKTETARDRHAQHRSGVCNDLTIALRRTPFALMPFTVAWKLFRHVSFAVRRGLLTPCLAGIGRFFATSWTVLRTRKPVRARTLMEFSRRSRPQA